MNFSHFKKLDWGIIGSAMLLTCFGLLGLWSIAIAKQDFSNFYKQIGFFAVGLLCMFLMSSFDYRILRNNSYFILVLYGLCLLSLLGLHFFSPVIKGTHGWYKIGLFSLDPIEPTKIIFIMLLAKYFSMRHVEMYKFRHIVLSGIYTFLATILIFIKPDLGGTLIFLLIWLGILCISGIKINHFLVLFLSFVLVASLAWVFLLKDYQKERVTAFLFPYDYFGASWSQNQTRISIGSGQLLGQGLAKGSQVQYGLLPEPHTDFIFSALAQEWGMLGVLSLFIVYGFLLWRVIQIAITSESNFPRLFASGFAIMLIVQFSINIGMNVSLLPVVGIYLPFVSYGGSGLIANFISVGILEGIAIRNKA